MHLSEPGRELLDRSMAILDGWWDPSSALLRNPPRSFDDLAAPGSLELVPQSGWYAAGLLLRDERGDRERAADVIRAVIATQYDEPGTVWHGTYARFGGWPHPTEGAVEWRDYDPNWREFLGTTFAVILHRFAERLPQGLADEIERSIALAQRGEPDGRIPVHYANIALMKAWLDADVGRRTGDASLVERGEGFAAAVVERFEQHGAFDEYGSPTYYGIDLYALALWRELPPTPPFAEWAASVEAALWGDIARWYHPGLRNLCGPFSRSYGMDMRRYAALLGLWLVPALGPDAPFPALGSEFSHAHDLSNAPMAALLGTRVPDRVLDRLRSFDGERAIEQVITSSPSRVATGWLAESVMIGAEDAEQGPSADGQYHPATVHWRLPGGGVGTIRGVHRGPLRATAERGLLRVRAHDHRRSGPQPTRFLVDLDGEALTALSATRWDVPGLRVQVDGPTAGVEAVVTDAGAEVVWPPGPVELTLRVEAR